jgi:hypothetical protein
MEVSDMNMPGFTAEATLCKTNGHYRFALRGIVPITSQRVMPQFSMKAFVCAAVVAGILAGQEELIPVLINAGCLEDA